jgi:type II secretion system protein G
VSRQKGFTLLELLVVIAIIGILAAIAIPGLLAAIQRSKQRRTMADMKTLATAWEARAADTGRYNAAGAVNVDGADQEVDIALLAGEISPTYIRTVPHHDAWGNTYSCYLDKAWGAPEKAGKYAIISPAKDGVIADPVMLGPMTNYDCDIIFGAGTFLAYPEGTLTKQ